MSFLWLSYPPSVFWILSTLFGILTATTLFIATRSYIDRTRDQRELWLRTKTWWIIFAVVALALGSAEAWSPAPYVLFGFISFIALKEFLSIVPTRRVDRPIFAIAYLAVPLQYLWASSLDYHGLFQMSLFVYVCPLMVVVMLIRQQTERFTAALGTTLCGLLIAVYSISHLAHLFSLPAEANPNGGVVGLVFYLIVLVQGNDVAQYVSGKMFGKRKIIPRISPNKTWAGLFGGMSATTAISIFAAPILTPFPLFGATLLGMVISIGGFFGDLFVSAIKRDVGVKDASSFLPGHGGMLDRVDSLTITAPLFFHLTYYFVFVKGGFV